jgi:hypothetical protein
MSTFQALTLILATVIFGGFLLQVLSKMAETQSHTIVIGVYNGVPLSTEHRKMMLWNYYLPTGNSGVITSVFLGIVLAQIGKNVAEPTVQLFAYGAAGVLGLNAFLWLAGTISGVIYFTSVLRKTTRL